MTSWVSVTSHKYYFVNTVMWQFNMHYHVTKKSDQTIQYIPLNDNAQLYLTMLCFWVAWWPLVDIIHGHKYHLIITCVSLGCWNHGVRCDPKDQPMLYYCLHPMYIEPCTVYCCGEDIDYYSPPLLWLIWCRIGEYVTRNGKIIRLPVLPLEVQAIYWSSLFWWPAFHNSIVRYASLCTFVYYQPFESHAEKQTRLFK